MSTIATLELELKIATLELQILKLKDQSTNEAKSVPAERLVCTNGLNFQPTKQTFSDLENEFECPFTDRQKDIFKLALSKGYKVKDGTVRKLCGGVYKAPSIVISFRGELHTMKKTVFVKMWNKHHN